jgi:hypothetical protein
MKRQRRVESQFAVCVKNTDYPVSLEVRKLYQVVPDAKAARHHLIRIVDESGEDYLYPDDYFIPIELPQRVEEVLRLAS